jgi:hypothetical protein
VSKTDNGVDYFFFRRFFAGFFAAAFFLFFAIAALLAWVDGDISAVPSRIDGHYDRITTAGEKEQSLH